MTIWYAPPRLDLDTHFHVHSGACLILTTSREANLNFQEVFLRMLTVHMHGENLVPRGFASCPNFQVSPKLSHWH